MRLPDEVRKCVAMLSFVDTNGRERFAGTAFIVAVPGGKINPQQPTIAFPYLVTARHVIEKIHSHSQDRHVYIRVNQKDSAAALQFRCPTEEWLSHDTDISCDVAIVQCAMPKQVDIRYLPIDMFVTDRIVEEQGIGLGTDLFVTGIFRSHLGAHRNIPIIRAGAIAAMPEEPIATAMGEMEGYLAEVRSVSGLSGSPVFAFFRSLQNWKSAENAGVVREGLIVGLAEMYLLGLVHGHWDIDRMRVDMTEQDVAQNEEINVGITIVVPSQKIHEVLNRKDLSAKRAEAMQDAYANSLPAMDTADKEPLSFGKSEFETALRKVSRRVGEPDEGTS